MPMHMRVQELRGFKNLFRVEYQILNLSRLGELFPDGGAISVDDLVAHGAVRAGLPVKVLGLGEKIAAAGWSTTEVCFRPIGMI